MKFQLKIYQLMIPTTQKPNDANVPKILKKKHEMFTIFCYVGHVSLSLKINKIRPNILQKPTIKNHAPTWMDLNANMPLFLVGFGSKLVPKS